MIRNPIDDSVVSLKYQGYIGLIGTLKHHTKLSVIGDTAICNKEMQCTEIVK